MHNFDFNYKFAGPDDAVSGTDAAIRNNVTDFQIEGMPTDAQVFEKLQQDSKVKSGLNNDMLKNITAANYDIKWYVVKHQDDGWHIDGALVKKVAYGVSYQYQSGTEGMALPAAIDIKGDSGNYGIPADPSAYSIGKTVSPFPLAADMVGKTYDVKDEKGNITGTWKLTGWTPNQATMTEDGVTFTGTWVYTAKHTVTVNYYQDGTLASFVVAQTGYEGSDYAVDSALTSGKTMDGYKFDHTDGSTTGTLDGDKVINVYFVKNTTPAEPTTPSNPTNPTNPTNPSTPSTTVTVPDATTPTASTPDVTIPAAETPTTEAPTTTEIPDAATPLTSKPDATDTHEIPEEAAAKAEAPKTGDNLLAMLLTAAASLGGIVTLSSKRKKNA